MLCTQEPKHQLYQNKLICLPALVPYIKETPKQDSFLHLEQIYMQTQNQSALLKGYLDFMT